MKKVLVFLTGSVAPRQKQSFDFAQNDVTLSGVEVLPTLKFIYLKLESNKWYYFGQLLAKSLRKEKTQVLQFNCM